METLSLALGVALPWLLGFSALAALGWPRDDARGNSLPLRIGFGYMLGALVLTLWMRALSALGIAFGWGSIGFPLAATAAGLLFQRDGFAATSIEQIAERAELSTGTVYNYFPSKGDLLLALVALDGADHCLNCALRRRDRVG